MKSDLSRQTFDPKKHYSSVRMQQGRVQLDADWNEQSDIVAHRIETEALDIIGGCGGPLHSAAFHIVTKTADLTVEEQNLLENQPPPSQAGVGDFLISAGHYYVDGILCENDHIIAFTGQPDLPGADKLIKKLSTGLYLVYLDVWQRHITALDDPRIREVALGGPDTATRTKTVWQVRWLRVGDDITSGNCLSEFKEFQKLIAASNGKLSARAKPEAVSTKPCIVPPGAGYRGLENQLYRVEIHEGGQLNGATFKWSRDNGSVVTAIEKINDKEITVQDLGPDDLLGFAPGQWVEITDDALELNGNPGQFLQIDNVDPVNRVITLKTAPKNVDAARHPKLRRWDNNDGLITVSIPSENDGWNNLENGIQVKFSSGTYKTGDYWTIPARTATADEQSGKIEWPQDEAMLPFGIQHHYCRLALSHFDGNTFTPITDCRNLFPPVTELTSLFYVSGDGQEAMPDDPLPQLLQVGVFNGRWPVAGARVRFVAQDNGRVAADKAGLATATSNTIEIITGGSGIASCAWRLEFDVTKPSQQVETRLLNANGDVLPPVVCFNGNLSIADQVYYDPKQCGTLQDQKTVQKAIDRLSQLVSLYHVSGDGQEGMPEDKLQPLVVVAANKCGPVKDQKVKVRFQVVSGSGKVNGSTSIEVPTEANGLATCNWTLDSSTPNQQVEATLLADNDHPTAPPTSVHFTANPSIASQVAYDPSACEYLVGVGDGLRGEYYEGINFDKLKLTRVDTDINFDWGSGSPHSSIPADSFSIRWTGKIRAKSTGAYTFYTETDDGVRLWMNDKLIIDFWKDQPPTKHSGSIDLEAGRLYDIKIEYYEKGGGAVARFSWSSPSTPEEIVPQEQLFSTAFITVQDAIDRLCQTGDQEPGIRVKDILLNSGGALVNDTAVPVGKFLHGLRVVCNAEIEQDTVRNRPTCFVTLDMPFPFNKVDQDLWQQNPQTQKSPVIGFQPLILAANVNADNNVIFWTPSKDTQIWLQQCLFQKMKELQRGDRVLAHLTLKGNFIWAQENSDLYLDGEAFGLKGENNKIDLRLPSGNSRRGGDFEMWFWLVSANPH